MKIFFSVGEPSGDNHAAHLIHELKALEPDLECVGFGGPKMAAAGCTLHFELTQLAVMWIVRVLWNIRTFFRLVDEAEAYFRAEQPDAVVLVDFPGFNWHIAKRAKACGIPVYYYCPPQLWAWAGWRMKKMQATVDHVLCTLPFERDYFAAHGLKTVLVGHPFFEATGEKALDTELIARLKDKETPLVVILPGSRKQEVLSNLPSFLEAAVRIRQQVRCRFAIAAFKEEHAEIARWRLARYADELENLEIFVGQTPELIRAATCCLAVSGSVSLELLDQEQPTAILYKVSRFGFFVQSLFRRVKYITLVNLLATDELHPRDCSPFDPRQPGAERVPFPELLTYGDPSPTLAAYVVRWLKDPVEYARRKAMLADLKQRYARPGASRAAALYIMLNLNAPRPDAEPLKGPHFAAVRTPA